MMYSLYDFKAGPIEKYLRGMAIIIDKNTQYK